MINVRLFTFISIVTVLCGDQTLYANALSVEIGGNVSGILGENGTEIQCLYTMENVLSISTVNIKAFNRSSVIFEQIAVYLPGGISTLTPQGQYLKGRVTLTRITQSSTRAVMIFNKLMCIDDTVYKFRVIYTDNSFDVVMKHSSNISVQVQVAPTRPDKIFWIKAPADLSTTPTALMPSSNLSPSTALTTKEHESLSTMASGKKNDTTLFNHFTLPTIDHNILSSTSSNSDSSYTNNLRTTTYSILQTTTTQGIAEGDNITVVCTGDVGKPKAKHFFEKYLNRKIVPMLDTISTTSTSAMSENCSYYRTSNLTFQVTAKDNNAVIRCVVHSSMADPDMYVETEPIEVYYEARMPTIIKYPNKPYYVVGENTSILLTCKSDGNPKPYYQWYKENDNTLISTNEILTITDMNVTNSGIYTCNVSNTFNGYTHRNAEHVQIDIINKASIAPTTTFRTSVSNETLVIKQSNNENTAVIVVGTVCGLIILVICVILLGVLQNKKKTFRCLLRRNRPDRSVDYVNTIHQQDPSLYEGVSQALDEHNYEQLSRMEHVYNNTNLSNN